MGGVGKAASDSSGVGSESSSPCQGPEWLVENAKTSVTVSVPRYWALSARIVSSSQRARVSWQSWSGRAAREAFRSNSSERGEGRPSWMVTSIWRLGMGVWGRMLAREWGVG